LDVDARIATLEQELRAKDDYIQITHEELENSNEELKSSNEEMQSVNEELQSTNEELETSKEELQSVNEELATVNTELQTKVLDLSRVNNDMNNLLAGTGIATVFVDKQLHILRFTPTATELINLIPGDLGRPVGHLVSNLVAYNTLVTDVQAVLDTEIAKELEVQATTGSWFAMRMRPYRVRNEAIEGVVITFVDITEIRRVRAALNDTSELLALTGEMAKVGGWKLDLASNELTVSPATRQIIEADPLLAMTLDQLFDMIAPEQQPAHRSALQAAIDSGTPWSMDLRMTTARGRSIRIKSQGAGVMENGKTIRLHGVFQDITERNSAQEVSNRAGGHA
jgi:two-component system CheB/CheR fusion protein